MLKILGRRVNLRVDFKEALAGTKGGAGWDVTYEGYRGLRRSQGPPCRQSGRVLHAKGIHRVGPQGRSGLQAF